MFISIKKFFYIYIVIINKQEFFVGLTFLNRVVNNSRYISKEYQIGFIYVNIQTRWVDQDVSDPEGKNSSLIYIKLLNF